VLVLGAGQPPSSLPGLSPRTAERRRRRPSQAEQERREAWGRKWGPMVREATEHLREAK